MRELEARKAPDESATESGRRPAAFRDVQGYAAPATRSNAARLPHVGGGLAVSGPGGDSEPPRRCSCGHTTDRFGRPTAKRLRKVRDILTGLSKRAARAIEAR